MLNGHTIGIFLWYVVVLKWSPKSVVTLKYFDDRRAAYGTPQLPYDNDDHIIKVVNIIWTFHSILERPQCNFALGTPHHCVHCHLKKNKSQKCCYSWMFTKLFLICNGDINVAILNCLTCNLFRNGHISVVIIQWSQLYNAEKHTQCCNSEWSYQTVLSLWNGHTVKKYWRSTQCCNSEMYNFCSFGPGFVCPLTWQFSSIFGSSKYCQSGIVAVLL